MTPADISQVILDHFGSEVITHYEGETLDPWVVVSAAEIQRVALFCRDDEQLDFKHLNDLTVVDYFEPDEKLQAKFDHEPHLEVVYHLSSLTLHHRFKLKVHLPRWKDDVHGELPEIDTVSNIWKIADWHEREAYDMFGVRFLGHPNLRRILCPEDWVGHALRKDYEFPEEYHGIRAQ